MSLDVLGRSARAAARSLAMADTKTKNAALAAIANALRENETDILKANAVDLENGRKNGMSQSLLDRLALSRDRIEGIAAGVEEIISLPDPVGEILDETVRPNGLVIKKTAVPIGVIGIIFEARPNVTVDAAALCLKSGNACILRGGKEAINSNIKLMNIMRAAVTSAGLPADVIALVEDTGRDSANEMMHMRGYLDLLIPRGGAGLIRAVAENSSVPVIETGVGNCHIFVDKSADITMAANIVYNAKCQRPSVCNAVETLLVHEDAAVAALPAIAARLAEKNTEIRGCEKTRAILGDTVVPATDEDYATEYNDYILAVRVVKDIDEAIAHIVKYSSGHSECIITEEVANADRFLREIDAAAVYHNASTRFTDGGCFGLGAEIGISTGRLHARGPMGLHQLTIEKYIVTGNGQIR